MSPPCVTKLQVFCKYALMNFALTLIYYLCACGGSGKSQQGGRVITKQSLCTGVCSPCYDPICAIKKLLLPDASTALSLWEGGGLTWPETCVFMSCTGRVEGVDVTWRCRRRLHPSPRLPGEVLMSSLWKPQCFCLQLKLLFLSFVFTCSVLVSHRIPPPPQLFHCHFVKVLPGYMCLQFWYLLMVFIWGRMMLILPGRPPRIFISFHSSGGNRWLIPRWCFVFSVSLCCCTRKPKF